MRGALAPLGVGIVDVVIHGELVPFFRHLYEVMLIEELPHDARIARSRLAEIMDELELSELIVSRTDDSLHDLYEHAARVVPECSLGAVKHFVVQCSEGCKTVFCRTDFVQAAQQVYDGLRHAVLMRCREVEYAVRVKAGFEYLVLKVGRRSVVNDIIDHFQEFAILSVKVEHFSHSGNLQKMKGYSVLRRNIK